MTIRIEPPSVKPLALAMFFQQYASEFGYQGQSDKQEKTHSQKKPEKCVHVVVED
jgi:hypothetical protein